MRPGPLIALPLFGILAGCCTTASTDPREGGLVGGVCGQATGAYSDRLAQRRNALGDLDEIERRFVRVAAQERAAAEAATREVDDLNDRIAQAQAAVRETEQILGRIRVMDEVSEAEKRRLLAELASLKAALDVLRDESREMNRRQRLRDLELRERELEERSRALERRTRRAPEPSAPGS
ncbi:hypothetical protein [Salinarimonas rosea]|uniref:hypothetical protein n=1 Tax=Salinarimonas rosea TaxID=552063 RepID=UPI0004095604|nr:hypothetical protein [Salinarimonas rosea]